MIAIHQPITEDIPPLQCGTSAAPNQPTASTSAVDHLLNDKDYLPSKFNIPGSYNYLDPNYMPSGAQ